MVYVPPEGSKYASPDRLLEIEHVELLDFSKDYNYLCMMGDFNARVVNLFNYYTVRDFLMNQSKL